MVAKLLASLVNRSSRNALESYAMNQLKLADLRLANSLRLPQFKNAAGDIAHSKPDGSDWSPADWMVAVVGELGEAANVMKKMRRGDFGAYGSATYAAAEAMLSKEFADVLTYLDLMAAQFGIDLGDATMHKFNEVSRRVGASIFMQPCAHDKTVIVYDVSEPE
jgi:NTP pyrophosphatase (non-canonical NTP hydrolase)